MSYINFLNQEVIGTESDNSAAKMLLREGGFLISKEVTVSGTGGLTANVLQFTGTVRVMDQWAELTEVTTLTNATDVYADIFDGTNTVNLTKSPGAVLSGAQVGSFFTKDKIASETYTALLNDEVRMSEAATKQAVPFTLVAKTGADNFIRFNLTTTDNPVSFKMLVWFLWKPVNGGTLVFL